VKTGTVAHNLRGQDIAFHYLYCAEDCKYQHKP
jgi:hypothetical protein